MPMSFIFHRRSKMRTGSENVSKKEPHSPGWVPRKRSQRCKTTLFPFPTCWPSYQALFPISKGPKAQGLLELPATPHPNALIVAAAVVAAVEAARGKAANN